MVGFCDFDGVGIAPVSNKMAVKMPDGTHAAKISLRAGETWAEQVENENQAPITQENTYASAASAANMPQIPGLNLETQRQHHSHNNRGAPPPLSSQGARERTALAQERYRDRDRDPSQNRGNRVGFLQDRDPRDPSRNQDARGGQFPRDSCQNRGVQDRHSRDPSQNRDARGGQFQDRDPRDSSQNRGARERQNQEARQVRNDGFEICPITGDVKIVEEFKEVPYRSDRQREREKRRHTRDLEDVRKQLVLFDIPTRDANGELANKKSDQVHVTKIFRELYRGVSLSEMAMWLTIYNNGKIPAIRTRYQLRSN